MLKAGCLLTTAVVLCTSVSFAQQETRLPVDANVQFVWWYSGSPMAGAKHHISPHDGSRLLYAQSASSGFSTYAISATNDTSYGACCFGNIAADDFILPGTGTHRITAVYAPGTNVSGQEPEGMRVTFYDKVKYYEKRGFTAVVLKATCFSAPFSDVTGNGSMLVDVSSCHLGEFKGGHDYAVAVQAESGECCGYTEWDWQTNRTQIRRQAFYFTYGGESGSCTTQFTPIKTCFPGTGYGPDLAFAIYGK